MAQEMNNSWMCTLCSGTYTLLPTLVSHIRAVHSHEQGLCFSCRINNCPKHLKTLIRTTSIYETITMKNMLRIII